MDITSTPSNNSQEARDVINSGYVDWSFLTGKIITTDTVPTYVPTSPRNQLVISNGALYIYDYTNNTWVSASGSGNTLLISTTFETAARFVRTTVGAGANTFADTGLNLSTSATLGSSAKTLWQITGGGTPLSLYSAGTIFSSIFHISTLGSTGSFFIGIGNITVDGTGHTFTDNHIGFKVTIVGSDQTLYATNASASTETATLLSTFAVDDVVSLALEVVSATNIRYSYRVNNGVWVTTTQTTNIPTNTSYTLQFSGSNESTASASVMTISGATIQR